MNSPARLPAAVLAGLLVSVVPALAAVESDPSTPGALRVAKPDGAVVEMPLRHTKVSIEVTAFVARATVEQVFRNPFPEPVEAVYTFPLGDRAAVDDFELIVGDRTIRGEIKRREDARATYEQARATGYQAALLEQERPNVFTQSVANLEPGTDVVVRLRTIETLRYERGVYRLTFPLVVGPRYIPGGAVADAARISPPGLPRGTRSGHDVEIAVTIDAGVPLTSLESVSHRTVVEKNGARAARVRLADDDAIPNKDFLLRWSVSSDRPALGFLSHRDGLDGFFTLLVQPKGEVGPAEAMPKEITFVVDTSGSMSGVPLEASKRFAAKALKTLGPRDTFNLIRFSGDNETYSKDALANDPQTIASAIAWLNRKQGGGGTELLAAIQSAFMHAPDPNRLRMVVFLTDGFVGNDAEILAVIAKVVADARIYTVGIGTSVNHSLLSRMAEAGRGSYVFVRPDERADDALEAFRSWVTLPYVTDLAIDWGALPVADLSPERLRDLGSGETLAIVGRYLASGEGSVVVRGKLGGRYFEQTLQVTLPERQSGNEALASLWARGRIEDLLRDTSRGVADSVKAEVTALALNHRLMSPYTSFVAVDDSRVVNFSGGTKTVCQPLPLPEGVSFEAIFGAGGPTGLLDASYEGADEAFATQVGGVSDVDPLTGTFLNLVTSDSIEGLAESVVVWGEKAMVDPGNNQRTTTFSSEFVADLPVAGETAMIDLDNNRRSTTFSSRFVSDLPVAGRFYQKVLSLSPGVQNPDGDGNPNVAGARERDFRLSLPPPPEFDDRVLDAALRVLADLADDGTLSPSEGRPALAALLAAQRQSGAIAHDASVHAVATWALAEAASKAPGEAWVAGAREKAVNYLAGGQETRWTRLVLALLRPDAEPAKRSDELRSALAELAKRGGPSTATGRSPLERLVRSIGRGHLAVRSG